MLQKIKKYDYVIISALLAALVFVLIYGTAVLDVTNDGWILANYDEWDNVQHYTGWTNYRNSPWQFPLGNTIYMAYPVGGNIAYADTMPLVSVFFKIFSPILPHTFQYAGIMMLVFFVLQGISAALIIKLLTDNKVYSVVSSLFFDISPVFLERGFRHTSLAAHFIVLFSIYFYFKYRRMMKSNTADCKMPWVAMIILNCLAIGITPYFLPMVMIFVLLLSLELLKSGFTAKKAAVSTAFFAVNIIAALLTGVVLGTLGQGVNVSRRGYGYYSMNLNAVINPSSTGGYKWSQFLQPRGNLYGQYDGFNYLGFGVILFVVFAAAAGAVYLCRNRKLNKASGWFKRNALLIFACVFLTAFAVSHIIVFDYFQIVEIPLPEFILNACKIFRASSRIFYPVYYLIFIFAITASYRVLCKNSKAALVVMLAFLMLQAYDLKGVLQEKHDKMQAFKSYGYQGPKELLELEEYELLISDYRDRYLLYISGYNNLIANAHDFNSGKYEESDLFGKIEIQRMEAEGINADYVYSTDKQERFESWQAMYGDIADFYIWHQEPCGNYSHYWVNDMYFMVPVK